MALSNKVLLIIIFILFAALLLNVFFGCRAFYEGFEAKEMTEEEIEAIKNIDPEKASELVQQLLKSKGIDAEPVEVDEEESVPEESEKKEEKAPEKKDAPKIIKTVLAKDTPGEKRPLTQKETELFKAISKDQVSNEDLEKLVKAGVISEKLVERFLNSLQDGVSTKTEAVVEGFSCQRDFATF